MKLHPLHDPAVLRPLLDADSLATVRMRNLLFRLCPSDMRVLVDDPRSPRGVLVNNDESFWDLHAPDETLGRQMLDALEADGQERIFAGLSEPLAAHLRADQEPIFDTPCTLFVLEPTADPPDRAGDARIVALGPEHADQAAAAWPLGTHEGFDKRGYLCSRIEDGPTAAVLEQGRPTAFVLTHADGSLGVLHTEPGFRGRGLARAVLAAQARQIAASGAPVFGYVIRGNAAAEHLMESVGLTRVREAVWLGLRE